MKNNSVKNNTTYNLTFAAILLAMAIAVQLFGRFNPEFSRPFVGPIINAIILLAVYYAKPKFGFLVAILTPIMALVVGQLNMALAPMVPFIIIANLILALCFALYNKTIVERIVSSAIGSLLKYGFFILVIKFILPLLKLNLPEKIQKSLPIAFGLTQLTAALIGSAIAIVLIEILNKIFKKEKRYY